MNDFGEGSISIPLRQRLHKLTGPCAQGASMQTHRQASSLASTPHASRSHGPLLAGSWKIRLDPGLVRMSVGRGWCSGRLSGARAIDSGEFQAGLLCMTCGSCWIFVEFTIRQRNFSWEVPSKSQRLSTKLYCVIHHKIIFFIIHFMRTPNLEQLMPLKDIYQCVQCLCFRELHALSCGGCVLHWTFYQNLEAGTTGAEPSWRLVTLLHDRANHMRL